MNARFPDTGTVRTVLALAARAPSVHNTQPWRWRVDAESLHLYADASRQLPNTDPDGRDLILSCGAALHHCVVALAAARNGVTLCKVEDLDKLHKIVAQSVWDHMNHDYLAELATWSGRYAAVAGVPARSTPVSDPTATIPGRFFAGPALPMAPESSSADDSAVVIALGTRTDDRLAQLRAGEATSAVLLSATSMGLASCPVTEPLEIAATRETVRSDVFGGGDYPQMLLRVGWAPINADPLPATPRRDLSDFVEWVDE